MSSATVAISIQQLNDRKAGLQTSNTEIQGVNSGTAGTEGLVGIATTSVFYYQSSAADIDVQIRTRINSINTKKQQIVNLCSAALAVPCGLGVTIPMPTANVGSGSDGVGTAWEVWSSGIVGVNTIPRAPIYPDTLKAWRFPDLESQTYTGDPNNPSDPKNDPVNNAGYLSIESTTSANLGIGKTTVRFQNDTGEARLGWLYDVASTGCADGNGQRRTQINQLITEISNLRTGIATLTAGVNPLKDQKHNAQLSIWGLKYTLTQNNNEITGINAALNVLNNMGSYT